MLKLFLPPFECPYWTVACVTILCVCVCVCVCVRERERERERAQSCPTLCDPYGLCSSVHGVLQGRRVEWVAVPFSRASSTPRDWTQVSCIAGRLFPIWATMGAPSSSRLLFYYWYSSHWLLGEKSFASTKESESVSCSARLFRTPWTIARRSPLSMGFSRQGYWSRLPFPSPEDLPDPGIEPESSALAGGFFTAWAIKEVSGDVK